MSLHDATLPCPLKALKKVKTLMHTQTYEKVRATARMSADESPNTFKNIVEVLMCSLFLRDATLCEHCCTSPFL